MFTGRMRIRVPGIFAAERERHALVGLQREDSWLGCTPDRAVLLEGEVRDRLERHRDLGDLARQPLAGAQVERHAGPAPVVDLQAQRGVGLGVRVRRARPPPRGSPATVLAADRARRRTARAPPSRRRRPRVGAGIACSTLTFSSRTSSAVKRDRRLHRDVAQQLQHVVLDEVAQRARAVVVAGARADADVLGRGDLDVVDVVAVPERLEHARWRTGTPSCSGRSPCPGSGRCGRPGCSSKTDSTRRLSSCASASVVPNGFSMMHAHLGVLVRRRARRSPSCLDDHREELGRGREVEGAVAAARRPPRRTRRAPRRASS